ncbi:VWA domain-containing protein [Stenotrophomonas sp. PS02289]|uniref:VWA domain-containing protein n=1 Tax=Stenotrophomonas sp. PS02289 TaxID=2991422 RepID=UPI00249B8C85|nr:VWA domain-containing protein [Stenotrophomonas sp. PS02289]
MTVFSQLHFLRPDLLWALLALPLIALLWRWRRRRASVWLHAVDAHLLPHLLAPAGRRAGLGLGVMLCGWTLAVLALAGPSWRQLAQPLWQTPAPLVVALDLSSRVRASDLPPSRLLQARAKLASLLRERQDGEVALLVYADDAFTVAPLTTDRANVALYLDALDPNVMPRDGQQAARALDAAVLLLQQSGAREGDILLITDRADPADHAAAARALAQQMRVSVLGLGTPDGAAYRADDGQIARAQLEEPSLRALAAAGGGQYARLTDDDTDLRALGVLQARGEGGDRQQGKALSWQDEGFWLVPPLMLLALLAFRRRALAMLVGLGLLLPLSLPVQVQAAESSWWQRADQQDQQRIAAGVDAYRQGDFAAAQQQFAPLQSAEGRYNLGNALARQGQYDAAIAAYDQALTLRPGMPDAVANRSAVEAARKRTPPASGSQGQSQSQQGQSQPGQAQARPRQSNGQAQPGQGTPAQTPETGQPDPAEQARADAAQRARMQEALQRQAGNAQAPTERPATESESAQQREQRQAVEAWMRRVPDDPGSLLRTKFQRENERRRQEGR